MEMYDLEFFFYSKCITKCKRIDMQIRLKNIKNKHVHMSHYPIIKNNPQPQ